jgi:tRNA threonylcarbamoyladenosine biosynthesis protein TsaB
LCPGTDIIVLVETSAQFVLLLDTCGAFGSVALATTRPDARVYATLALPGRASSERLLPSIRDLIQQQGVGLAGLRAIAVVHGPGSFTGVRVGLSAAKGLCEALGIPLIAISRLAVLAAKSGQQDALAVLDAGRGEFYAGRYVAGLCRGEVLRTREQVAELMVSEPGLTAVVCEGAVAESLSEFSPVTVKELEAADSLELVIRRLEQATFDDTAILDANYVRNSDAEIFAKPARLIPARI